MRNFKFTEKGPVSTVLNENDGMAHHSQSRTTLSVQSESGGQHNALQWTCNILNCEIMSRYLSLISRVSICCSFHAFSIANHLSNSPVSICRVYANTVPGKFNAILRPKFIKIGEHPVSMWSWSLFLAGENFLTSNFCLRQLSTVHNCAFGWWNALI